MATVNEGRVDMWICDKYELSDEAKKLTQLFEKMIVDDLSEVDE
jgi:hypothetical protein